MADTTLREIQFVCQHGAFRSRIAAAYFKAGAPVGWTASSAGITPQSAVSERLRPLLAGTPAAPHVDEAPPRPMDASAGTLTIALDAHIPGAETWRIDSGSGAPLTDVQLRDAIARHVASLVEVLANGDAV